MKESYQIVTLRDRVDLTEQAVAWFSAKWRIPAQAYRESIQDSQMHPGSVPQWYLMLREDGSIAGGLGVIENDFHKRPDLTPNVCAVYVEKEERNQGIARALLQHVCREVADMGYDACYLLTDHTDFYEKCGWEFFTMVEEEGGGSARMYRISLR